MRQHNTGDLPWMLSCATKRARLQQTTLYVFPTAYGFRIWHECPPYGCPYYRVTYYSDPLFIENSPIPAEVTQ